MTAPLRKSGRLVSAIKRSCEDKTRYTDEFVARSAGQHLQSQRSVKLYTYKCDLCRGWHLTRSEQAPYFDVDYFLEKEPE